MKEEIPIHKTEEEAHCMGEEMRRIRNGIIIMALFFPMAWCVILLMWHTYSPGIENPTGIAWFFVLLFWTIVAMLVFPHEIKRLRALKRDTGQLQEAPRKLIASPITAKCPYCNTTFPIICQQPTTRLLKIKCPQCGKKSMLR